LDEQDPYCVVRRWIELEHEDRTAGVAPFAALVYVARTPSADAELPQDFARFYGGADLLRAPVVVAPGGAITVGAPESLLAACGLAPGGDVRRPAVSWDGTRIAFAARARAEDPLRIYVHEGGTCAVEPTIARAPVGDDGVEIDARGELIHDFDPAFSPDGRLVFASTRGNVTNVESFEYRGPQRSPADPSRQNANLYVVEGGAVRQLTFLLNQELEPSFMTDGRLIFVTEKRAPGFYQLAARRLNMDGGDYHPLFGQRATIGHRQVGSPVELADKNFAAIFSQPGVAHGAGALGVVNRSLGVDQASPDEADYLQDPAARDWQNPRFFQRSVRILDGASRPGEAGGVYRSPARLPDGRILVSYAADVADPASFSGRFELVVVDPVGGARSAPILSEARDILWAVPVAGRAARGAYRSKLDEPNGATRVSGTARGPADVTFLDVPLMASLLFQNTRSRRVVPAGRGPLELWESLPPEPGVTSLDPGDPHVVEDELGRQYVRRRRLGSALPLEDYSLRVRVPGGMPLVLAPEIQLAGDRGPARHHQLEELQFYPGETVHIGFRRELFDGVCGSCHGTLSGFEHDVSVNPDILTQASAVQARDADPVDLTSTSAGPSAPPFP
ncbi:MAG: PD40 domain-containing protein, partial [Deltaproteobacteria bacterium]|nr:PD40 domain-containing protein [Deltaproteobacteria bacterium]